MKKFSEKILRVYNFLLHDIWRITGSEISRTRKIFYDAIKTLVLAVRGFTEDKLQSKASALTYYTLFALVPVLALIFALARGFGFQERIVHWLTSQMSSQPDLLPYLLDFVDKYLARSQGGIFVGVGIALLFWSVMSAFKQIEMAFNDIWQIKKLRSFVPSFTTYFSLMLIVPVFIVVSSALSVFMTTQLPHYVDLGVFSPLLRISLKTIPYIINWILFTGLFIIIPNTQVKFLPALIAGVFTGTFFQLFQYLYIKGQVYLTSYNAVYGSFAVIPLLLLFLQISWIIILLGAELSFVVQNISKFEYGADIQKISRRYHDYIVLVVMFLVIKRFESGESSLSVEEISRENAIPIRLASSVVNDLLDAGLISELSAEKNQPKTYQPAVDINVISISYLLEKMGSNGSEDLKIKEDEQLANLKKKLEQLNIQLEKAGGAVLIKDLDK